MAYGADASGARDALQKKCVSLLDGLVSTEEVIRFDEFLTSIHRYAHAPLSRSPQSQTSLQQFSGFTAHDSSRFHAGNSYVENQNNFYAPTTPMPRAQNNEFSERNQNISALLAALEFPQMNHRRMNIEKEFPGTCTWLESTEEYKTWHEPWEKDRHCMLWIKGVPGAGKSTIMRYAYNKEKASSSHMAIAFFFNATGCDLEKSVEGMFRALLCQLIGESSSDPGLPTMVTRSDQELFKEHGWPLVVLKDLFRQAARYHTSQTGQLVVSYIDALDECDEDEVRELLTYFEDLIEEMAVIESPRVCFSSRPYPKLSIYRCETIILHERTEQNSDIRKYTLSRLRAAFLDESASQYHRGLISEIIKKSSSVFLWVVLVTARLKKSADRGVHPRMLRKHLLEIPSKLYDLFDTMNVRDETSDCLLSVVQWVLFAQGRLRAIDLYFAVASCSPSLSRSINWSDRSTLDGRWLRNFILTSSKGFLRTIDTDSTSYMPCEFVHESVREYFLHSGLQKLDWFLGTDVVTTSHAHLAEKCMHYLEDRIGKHQSGSWWEIPEDTWDWDISEDTWELPKDITNDSDALDATPLLAYIRDNGAFLHAEIADRNGSPQIDFCRGFNFAAWLALLQYPRYEPGGSLSLRPERARTMRDNAATPLHILVDNEMESLVQRVLQLHEQDDDRTREHYVNALCGGLGTALHIAVERNNTTIIRALITSGAYVDFHCQPLGTPLDYAMLLERTQSVEVLLELGATTRSELSPHQRRKILNVRSRP